MRRDLDAIDVLLSAAAAETDAELHAARAAAVGIPEVRAQLLAPAGVLPGTTAGRALLADHPVLGRARTSLAFRLGVISRRDLAAGVGVYLLPPAHRAAAALNSPAPAPLGHDADLGGTCSDDRQTVPGQGLHAAGPPVRELDGDEDLADAGHAHPVVPLAGLSLAALLLATAGAATVNGATLLALVLVLACLRPLFAWASQTGHPSTATGALVTVLACPALVTLLYIANGRTW